MCSLALNVWVGALIFTLVKLFIFSVSVAHRIIYSFFRNKVSDRFSDKVAELTCLSEFSVLVLFVCKCKLFLVFTFRIKVTKRKLWCQTYIHCDKGSKFVQLSIFPRHSSEVSLLREEEKKKEKKDRKGLKTRKYKLNTLSCNIGNEMDLNVSS